MDKIKVIIEKTPESYWGYIDDISGVIATVGDTIEEVKKKIHEAIDLHLEVLRDYNSPIPEHFQGEYELVYVYDKSVYEDYEVEKDYEHESKMAMAR